jgi:hypothetical protein
MDISSKSFYEFPDSEEDDFRYVFYDTNHNPEKLPEDYDKLIFPAIVKTHITFFSSSLIFHELRDVPYPQLAIDI